MSRNVIVPEVLISLKNYDEWSICMKNYLIAQDLWDVVECSSDLRKKNAAVLQALQISCAPEIFARIASNNSSAKVAWDNLAKIYKQKYKWPFLRKGSLSGEGQEAAAAFERWFEKPVSGESKRADGTRNLPLFKLVFENKWNAVINFLYRYPEARSARLQHDGSTILHMVVSSGNVEALRKLLQIMLREELETTNGVGETALAVCAIQGTMDIADCLIRMNEKLISMTDQKGMIPVVKACAQRKKDMTLFLYLKTSLKTLSPENGNHGSLLLHFCILNEMLDIALNLLHHFPRLAITSDHRGSSPILILSAQPSRFISGNKFPFWKHWIYSRIQVQTPLLSRNDVLIYVSNADEDKQTDNKTPGQIQSCNLWSTLKELIGINQIHEQKLIHTCAREILRCMSAYLSTLNAKDLIESGVILAIFQAVQHGIHEFLNEILETNQDLKGYHQRFILLHALEYRQEKFFFNEELSNLKTYLLEIEDKEKNNVLHLVAKLAPESCLARIPGAALQMQREFQWFKEIEYIVPECKESVNLDGETPQQVFVREHKELVRRGEEWMKQTSQSYTVVGALIVTVVFAAAFTIPGGNNQNTGYPMFLDKRLFSVFIISDAISLFSATTSVIIFLGILTSRYTEKDFLESLPRKLIIGLCTLFISIVAMMIAFCDAVAIMLKGQQWVVITLIFSASIPVIVFLLLQTRLLAEIFRSTYGWGLLKRKRLRIRYMIKSMRKLMMKKRVQ